MVDGAPFTAAFERDHLHMTVAVAGDVTADDLERFQAACADAGRRRRREWTVDARQLGEGAATFARALVWLRRTWGHVCVLNPSADLQEALEALDVHHSIVVRTDSRADDRPSPTVVDQPAVGG